MAIPSRHVQHLDQYRVWCVNKSHSRPVLDRSRLAPQQLTYRLGLVDSAEKLPDRREVLGVVDQQGAGGSHR